ncbi:MFS transporter [Palaeococcus ferrophilus]|uniref:MFS transporter n=1 Tax=Palaeococcus ferrophilus TaxID=83868 RepID=UPI0009FCA707|nr:MFS transporter [Palaeococcus ferrophilus]
MGRALAQGFAGFAGILDTSFLMPVIALYAMSLGATPAQAGAITALYSAAAIPASVLAGILVDRFGRRRTLTLGLLWDSAVVFLYAYAGDYIFLAFLRVLHALGGSLVFPALISMARESDSNGRNGLVRVLASIAVAIAVGSAASGILTSRIGYGKAFFLLSAVIAIAGIVSTSLPETLPEGMKGAAGSFRELKHIRSPVFRGLWLIFFLYVALGIITGGLATSLVYRGLWEERSARMVVGLGLGVASLVAAGGFFVYGRLLSRITPGKIALYSSLLSSAGLLTGAAFLSPGQLLVSLGIFGVGISGLMLSSTVFVTDVPPEVRGTSVGLQQVFNILGVTVGASIGGFLAALGPPPVLIFAGLALVLGGTAIFK